MIEISRAEAWPLSLYPEVSGQSSLILSHYAIVVEYKEGYLLHHTITWCMYYLTKEEYDDIFNNDEMKKLKIVLDSSIDEDSIAERVYLMRAELKTPFKMDSFKQYVIMTTSACNARCPYCYEKGIAAITMNEKTAEDVVQFIKKTHKGLVSIRWFGGEPLLNTKVIEYISRRLNEEGIDFYSEMITNGYFLEKYVTEFGVWRINKIQVTIDNINGKYDEIKRFVSKDEDPFKRVISGIHRYLLLEDSVIGVRINVSDDNIDDLENIFQYLGDEFGNDIANGKMVVSSPMVFSITCDKYGDKPLEMWERIKAAREKFPNVFPRNDDKKGLILKTDLHYCTSDIGLGIVINPAGKFSPCEHWKDEEAAGDVVNGLTNKEKVEEWRLKGGKNIEFCKKMRCPILPTCKHSYKCDACPVCSTERKFENALKNEKGAIIRTYEYYLKKISEK